MDSSDDTYQVISLHDEKAKILAMEMANDKGRMVLNSIFEGRKSSTEISKELSIGLSTVLFHIERLKETGIIKVIDTELSKKFREIKYYGPSTKAILIVPSGNNPIVESKPASAKITQKLMGISAIVGAGLSGLFITIFSKTATLAGPLQEDLLATSDKAPDVTIETIRNTGTDTIVRTLPTLPEMLGLIVLSFCITFGLLYGYYYAKDKKKEDSSKDE